MGRSEIFDFCVALFATNMLLKAGVIGACMAAAWCFAPSPEQTVIRRRRMILVLFAAMCSVAYTKVAARLISYPRPVVLTHQTLRFEGERLSPYQTVSLNTPADAEGRKRAVEIGRGFIDSKDWESFPSDHAAFFGAIALGLLWVHPPIGLVAGGWVFLVIFPAKLLPGMHRPSDLFAGLAIALLALFLWSLFERNGLLARAVSLTMRYNVIATALFFLVAFETASTLVNLQDLVHSTRDLLGILRR